MARPPTSADEFTCNTTDHRLHRRLFLRGLTATGLTSMASFGGLFTHPALAQAAKKSQKRCILLWLCGAPSQFETWDPKPGRPTGGPFGSIPTSIPGVHFSSLMPKCASIAHKLNVVRSMKTNQPEHFQAISLLTRGNPERQGFTRPTLGAALSRAMNHRDTKLPDFILLDHIPGGNEWESFKAGDWTGWLGAEHAAVRLGGDYTQLKSMIADIPENDREAREELRKFLNRKRDNENRSTAVRSQNAAFERLRGLTSNADLFDVSKLAPKDTERYGPGAFGMHSLMARNLVEQGAPFVMVANGMNWDNHVFQHEIHQMLVPELDRVLFHLVNDLEERGLLDSTLVIAMGEFGRTPWINAARGRDHYPDAWSMMMTGCGLKRGVVTGTTDENGVHVTSTPFSEQNLFATIFTALGLDPHAEYGMDGMPTFHYVEDHAEPIRDLLA